MSLWLDDKGKPIRCGTCGGRLHEAPVVHNVICPALRHPKAKSLTGEKVRTETKPRSKRGLMGELPPHGTRRRYVHRLQPCRSCEPCIKANSDYLAEWKLRTGYKKPSRKRVAA